MLTNTSLDNAQDSRVVGGSDAAIQIYISMQSYLLARDSDGVRVMVLSNKSWADRSLYVSETLHQDRMALTTSLCLIKHKFLDNLPPKEQ